MHPDEHLSLLQDRPIDVFDPEDLWRAVAVEDHCLHRLLLDLLAERVGLIGAPCFHLRPAYRAPPAFRPRAGGRSTTRRDDPALVGEDAPPEVCAVDSHAPSLFVDRPQFGERERRADERSGDAREGEIAANVLDGIMQDPPVVEGKRREISAESL